MTQLFNLLSTLVGIYMVLITVRIILTWFSWTGNSGLIVFLSRITDPYLNWFRRFTFLRLGFLDISPIVALGVLSLFNRLLAAFAHSETITIGLMLALVLQLIWGVVSFIFVLLIIILILRLIAHLTGQNIYSPFWRIIDTISRPVLYRINRIFLRDRIADFRFLIIGSIIALVLSYFVLRLLVALAVVRLASLPL